MRQIEPKMVQYLDEKLLKNGLAQDAIKNKNARTLFLLAMQSCVGIREKTGNNDGPMVELIQETIGDHENEAWCMALVQTCIAYAEVKTGVKSPLFPAEHCLTVWRETPVEQRVKFSPLPGAIVIWKHLDDQGRSTENGHTGCVVGCDETVFQAVEGNTTSGLAPDGSIERNGGGVYFTHRSRTRNGSMAVVGFLKPF